MADIKFSGASDGVTAEATDRIGAARSDGGGGWLSRHITPAYIRTYIHGTYGANIATWLGTPSSANLAAAVTDETGSGALVFATSPTLVTPALGTPASGTLTNCTGLPVAGGGTGATTGRGAAANLSVPYILQKSGVTVTAPTDTNNNVVLTVSVPANAMGANGALRLYIRGVNTNNPNVKTVRVYIGAASAGTGGTLIGTFAVTNSSAMNGWVLVSNANATNSQQTSVAGGTNLPTLQALVTAAIDTTSAWEVVVAFQKATGSDSMTLNQSVAELLSDGT